MECWLQLPKLAWHISCQGCLLAHSSCSCCVALFAANNSESQLPGSQQYSTYLQWCRLRRLGYDRMWIPPPSFRPTASRLTLHKHTTQHHFLLSKMGAGGCRQPRRRHKTTLQVLLLKGVCGSPGQVVLLAAVLCAKVGLSAAGAAHA